MLTWKSHWSGLNTKLFFKVIISLCKCDVGCVRQKKNTILSCCTVRHNSHSQCVWNCPFITSPTQPCIHQNVNVFLTWNFWFWWIVPSAAVWRSPVIEPISVAAANWSDPSHVILIASYGMEVLKVFCGMWHTVCPECVMVAALHINKHTDHGRDVCWCYFTMGTKSFRTSCNRTVESAWPPRPLWPRSHSVSSCTRLSVWSAAVFVRCCCFFCVIFFFVAYI